MYVCMYICVYMCIGMCVCTCVYMHVYIMPTHVCMYVYAHAYIYMPKAFLLFLFSVMPTMLLLMQEAGQAVLGQRSELCLVEH